MILTKNCPLFDGRHRTLSDLIGHEEKIREDKIRMEFYDEMESDLATNGLVKTSGDRKLLFKLFCQVLINSFGILGK